MKFIIRNSDYLTEDLLKSYPFLTSFLESDGLVHCEINTLEDIKSLEERTGWHSVISFKDMEITIYDGWLE